MRRKSRRGRTRTARKERSEVQSDAGVAIRGRLNRARALLDAGSFDAATRAYAWLWANMLHAEPSFSGVRSSFMASEMEKLAKSSPAARIRFSQLRDRAAAKANATSGVQSRRDWMVLNELLGEPERTLEWFDEVKDDPRYAPALSNLVVGLERVLEPNQRWADLGRLYADPLENFRFMHENLLFTRGTKRLELIAYFERHFLDRVATLLRCLLAAGRRDDATAVHREALLLEPHDELRAALDAE